MRKTLTALAIATMVGASAVAMPSKAEAHSNGWWIPGAIIGGLAVGAIVSGAYGPYYYAGPYYYSGPYYYYGPRYYYRPYRYYYYHRPYRHRYYYYRHHRRHW